MPQIARPDEDVSAGTWTPSPSSPATLFDKIDEATPDDADFISSPVAPAAAAVEIGLQTLSDPGASDGHKVRYRIRKDQSGGAQIDGTAQLLQGAVVIASWAHTNVTNTWTTFEQTLSGAEADAITDYADLRVKFVGTQV